MLREPLILGKRVRGSFARTSCGLTESISASQRLSKDKKPTKQLHSRLEN